MMLFYSIAQCALSTITIMRKELSIISFMQHIFGSAFGSECDVRSAELFIPISRFDRNSNTATRQDGKSSLHFYPKVVRTFCRVQTDIPELQA